MIVALDMDEVLADLLGEWITLYNHIWHDDLTIDRILDWDLTLAVKPECGAQIHHIVEDGSIYRSVKPIDGAISGVEQLMIAGHDVIVVTQAFSNPKLVEGKAWWLRKHLSIIPTSNYFFCQRKQLIRADVLVDDCIANLDGFPGKRLLMDMPYNRHTKDYVRVHNWDQVVELLT